MDTARATTSVMLPTPPPYRPHRNRNDDDDDDDGNDNDDEQAANNNNTNPWPQLMRATAGEQGGLAALLASINILRLCDRSQHSRKHMGATLRLPPTLVVASRTDDGADAPPSLRHSNQTPQTPQSPCIAHWFFTSVQTGCILEKRKRTRSCKSAVRRQILSTRPQRHLRTGGSSTRDDSPGPYPRARTRPRRLASATTTKLPLRRPTRAQQQSRRAAATGPGNKRSTQGNQTQEKTRKCDPSNRTCSSKAAAYVRWIRPRPNSIAVKNAWTGWGQPARHTDLVLADVALMPAQVALQELYPTPAQRRRRQRRSQTAANAAGAASNDSASAQDVAKPALHTANETYHQRLSWTEAASAQSTSIKRNRTDDMVLDMQGLLQCIPADPRTSPRLCVQWSAERASVSVIGDDDYGLDDDADEHVSEGRTREVLLDVDETATLSCFAEPAAALCEEVRRRIVAASDGSADPLAMRCHCQADACGRLWILWIDGWVWPDTSIRRVEAAGQRLLQQARILSLVSDSSDDEDEGYGGDCKVAGDDAMDCYESDNNSSECDLKSCVSEIPLARPRIIVKPSHSSSLAAVWQRLFSAPTGMLRKATVHAHQSCRRCQCTVYQGSMCKAPMQWMLREREHLRRLYEIAGEQSPFPADEKAKILPKTKGDSGEYNVRDEMVICADCFAFLQSVQGVMSQPDEAVSADAGVCVNVARDSPLPVPFKGGDSSGKDDTAASGMQRTVFSGHFLSKYVSVLCADALDPQKPMWSVLSQMSEKTATVKSVSRRLPSAMRRNNGKVPLDDDMYTRRLRQQWIASISGRRAWSTMVKLRQAPGAE